MKVVSLDTDSALPPSPPSPTPSEDSVRLETTKTFPDVPPVVPLGDSLFPLRGDLAVRPELGRAAHGIRQSETKYSET